MKKNIIIAGTAILLIIGYVFGSKFYKSSIDSKNAFLASEDSKIFIRDHSPTLGPIDAKVILVEFLDPECETCRKFYPFVKQLMKKYPLDIRLVVRYTPFHKNSKFIVKILEASRKQKKYWEALALLFQTQPAWGSHHAPKPELVWDYLPSVGIDINKIKAEMNNPETDRIIEQDVADAQVLKVRQTPTFFINGKRLKEFGYQQLQKAIEDEIQLNN